ncbi:MAG TPA: hypothetical protein VKI00_12570 [Mycobacterium sp.]|uniref:hypothetical protein n=1 Tax=Mycobacterium sp. TaxID=1785 RepID=UPI002BDBEA9A|nr:hypothetical protein [Mycobacterium sp.]HME76446.1 hypothetical protein [Mycobacterium sp.]
MEPEDTSLAEGVEFYSRPQVEQLADKSWRAHYPASDWSVTAESRESVIERLKLEDQRRLKEQPSYGVTRFKALHRHLIEPIPGVYAITREEGERIRATQDPQAEFERIADEMDRQAGHR